MLQVSRNSYRKRTIGQEEKDIGQEERDIGQSQNTRTSIRFFAETARKGEAGRL